MKKLAFIVVLALIAAGCSSSSDPDDAADTTTSTAAASSSGATSTIVGASASTTTVTLAPTTTASAVSDVASCVVGEWEMDSQQFLETISASLGDDELPGEFTHIGGAYVLLIGADGTFSSERRDWAIAVMSDFGDLEMSITGSERGTYTLDGDELSTVLVTTAPLEVSMSIDGVPFDSPGGLAPITPPNAEFSGATISCDGDVLTATAEGFQSTWNRMG